MEFKNVQGLYYPEKGPYIFTSPIFHDGIFYSLVSLGILILNMNSSCKRRFLSYYTKVDYTVTNQKLVKSVMQTLSSNLSQDSCLSNLTALSQYSHMQSYHKWIKIRKLQILSRKIRIRKFVILMYCVVSWKENFWGGSNVLTLIKNCMPISEAKINILSGSPLPLSSASNCSSDLVSWYLFGSTGISSCFNEIGGLLSSSSPYWMFCLIVATEGKFQGGHSS